MNSNLVPASIPAPPAGYGDFLLEIKAQIRQRQFQALRAANRELLALYWWLGENISQRQQALGWGKGVVKNLARDLQPSFRGATGFQPVTSGTCWIFTATVWTSPVWSSQNCNCWLKKSPAK